MDLHPSGVNYTIVVGADGEAEGVLFDRLRAGQTYSVALPDYVYKNYKLSTQSAVENYQSVEQILEEYLSTQSPIKADSKVRTSEKR